MTKQNKLQVGMYICRHSGTERELTMSAASPWSEEPCGRLEMQIRANVVEGQNSFLLRKLHLHPN